jgi:hypothetical protein
MPIMTIKIKKSMNLTLKKVILGFKFIVHKVKRPKGLGQCKWIKNALWIMFHGLTDLLPKPISNRWVH